MRIRMGCIFCIAILLGGLYPCEAADSLAADTGPHYHRGKMIPSRTHSRSMTIYVDDDNVSGPWDGTLEYPYRYIQDAIDTAFDFDHVYVFSGVYEEHLSVDKTLHIIGEHKNTTIIDGGGIDDVISLAADDVIITHFTIQRSGSLNICKGMQISTNGNTIIDNIFQDNYYGIWIQGDMNAHNNITHNTIRYNERGIYLRYSQGNIIACNNFELNNQDGIYLSTQAINNRIYHNNFIDNGQNAWDSSYYDNFWDDGYPSGGNYWTDFDEPSEGAYDSNSDGIADASRSIPGGSKEDRYPLMHVYEYTLHVNANGPYGGYKDDTVEFIGDAVGGTEPYSWHWEFGDGDSSMVQSPDHIYQIPGEYTVILTVTDDSSYSDKDTTTATIEYLANANGPYEAIIGDTVEFLGGVYGGVPPYHWSWEFGDGDTSNLQNPEHYYLEGGEYEAVMAVVDSFGFQAYDTAFVHMYVPFVWVDDDFDDMVSGWEIDRFNNMTDGVNAAASAGTVFVFNGNYSEQVLIEKPLHLLGEKRDSTIVSGSGGGHVIKATGDNICIQGFTTGNGGYGIEINSADSVRVDSCMCMENTCGIVLEGATNATIASCVLKYNTHGILLSPQLSNLNNTIVDNIIQYNSESGIFFEHGYQESNIVQGNDISYNGRYGIDMVTSWYNEIFNNTFIGNDSYAILITRCMCGGQDNEFHHNDFILNNNGAVQAYDYIDYGQNYWYSQSDSEGNYWSDYDGQDVNLDGVGDTPYYLAGGLNGPDLYPLMEPVGEFSLCSWIKETSDPEAICIPIEFTGAAYGGTPPYSWLWDFGDGHSSVEQKPAHSYSEPDSYRVVLTVTDGESHTDDDTVFVTVTNIQAHAQGPSGSTPIYIPCQFMGSVYGGTAPYLWHWEFGDGQSSPEQNPVHSYVEPNIYTVIMTVSDSGFYVDADTIMISISNIQVDAQGPSIPQPINVPIQFTGDVEGGVPPYTWFWDFGDGFDTEEQNPIHSYDQPGIYPAVLSVTDSTGHFNADTLSVTIVRIHNLDKDAYYGTIQEAVDDADPNHTIVVSEGTYYEHEITIDKTLHLMGEDKNTTIVDGERKSGNVIQIAVDSVTVSGFTIKNCRNYTAKAGIKIHGNGISVVDNILISNGRHGIALRDGSRRNTISNNVIISNSYCGLKLYNDCRQNMIFGNTFDDNNQYGLYFTDSSDSNYIYHNTFANSSSDNARDECMNFWDDGYPSGGNWWGDYTGIDTLSGPDQDLPGSDGISDTPHNIPGGSNLDRYPIVDDQSPGTIDDLTIFLEDGAKSTSGNIRLIWSPPADDIGIERYVIYRSSDTSSPGDSLAETADTTYLDMGITGDVGTRYFYVVKAVDAVGNTSSESNRVGECDKLLYPTNKGSK